jgi:cytochrome c oxidase assembly factor CtaG
MVPLHAGGLVLCRIGIAAIGLALLSPIEALAGHLLAMHMASLPDWRPGRGCSHR